MYAQCSDSRMLSQASRSAKPTGKATRSAEALKSIRRSLRNVARKFSGMNPLWKQYTMLCGVSVILLGIFATHELNRETATYDLLQSRRRLALGVGRVVDGATSVELARLNCETSNSKDPGQDPISVKSTPKNEDVPANSSNIKDGLLKLKSLFDFSDDYHWAKVRNLCGLGGFVCMTAGTLLTTLSSGCGAGVGKSFLILGAIASVWFISMNQCVLQKDMHVRHPKEAQLWNWQPKELKKWKPCKYRGEQAMYMPVEGKKVRLKYMKRLPTRINNLIKKLGKRYTESEETLIQKKYGESHDTFIDRHCYAFVHNSWVVWLCALGGSFATLATGISAWVFVESGGSNTDAMISMIVFGSILLFMMAGSCIAKGVYNYKFPDARDV